MFFVGVCTGVLLVFGVNFFVVTSMKEHILTKEEYLDLKDVDCILVLGAKVRGDTPSPMLEDRLMQAIELYQMGVAKKIIMSGDHGRESYDEVNVMKNFAILHGVPSEDIFMDHAGFATYDSVVRAKEVFGVKKLVIVTQEYHLYRSLYIANSFGLEAYGVSSDIRKHSGQMGREIREILARDKDVVKCMFKPKPKFLGEVIPVSGNGDVTNDEKR
ncbi:MAG: YdcF family protein [Bacilli bacterium]|nr:YdcF family protein [Bacilli bacterium]